MPEKRTGDNQVKSQESRSEPGSGSQSGNLWKGRVCSALESARVELNGAAWRLSVPFGCLRSPSECSSCTVSCAHIFLCCLHQLSQAHVVYIILLPLLGGGGVTLHLSACCVPHYTVQAGGSRGCIIPPSNCSAVNVLNHGFSPALQKRLCFSE